MKGLAANAVNATIQGVRQGDFKKVWQLELGSAHVMSVIDNAGAGFSMELDFIDLEISQSLINPVTGNVTANANTFGWDYKDHHPEALDVAAKAASGSGDRASKFNMAVDGMNGGLQTANRGGWFSVSNLTLGASVSGSVKDEGGLTNPVYSAISIHVDSDDGLVEMMEFLTSGNAISGITIEGSSLNANNVEKTVYILSLGDTYVSSVADREGQGFDLDLNFTRYELELLNAKGEPKGLYGWDSATLKEFNGDDSGTPLATGFSDVLAGSRADDAIAGFNGADMIRGFGGNDILLGGNRFDTLLGGNGDDILRGGSAADILNGEAGTDTADYADSPSGVTVDLGAGTGTGGHAQDDVMSNIENVIGSGQNDDLTGNASANLLAGGSGDDTLIGGFGQDVLRGGIGKDTLTGGFDADKDTFDFDIVSDSKAGASHDVITDFTFDIDVIDLQDVFAGTLTWLGGGGTFAGVGQVTTMAAPDNPGADTIVIVNLSGDTTQDMEIRVNGQHFTSLIDVDFLL